MEDLILICLVIVTAPLLGSLVAGLLRTQIGRMGAQVVTISLVGVSMVLSLYVAKLMLLNHAPVLNENLY